VSEPTFFEIQRAFTRYLRDPEHVSPPPHIAPERLAIYTHAVIANAEMFIGDNFPRIKSVMPADTWSALVRDYFRRHESHTPLFVELPGQFLRYLEEAREVPEDPPYLYELAHFDFLENLVSTDEARIDESAINRNGDVMREPPVLNPTLRLIRYAFPVHRIDREYQPLDVPDTPTFIVAFRDRAHGYGTIDVNPATARALELFLGDPRLCGAEVMRAIAAELQHPDIAVLVAGGREIFARLAQRDVILGTAA
jgi:hypothetical protein